MKSILVAPITLRREFVERRPLSLPASVYRPADPASSSKLCKASECRSLTYGDRSASHLTLECTSGHWIEQDRLINLLFIQG